MAGTTLLVHGEQGVGDEVLFASCYGELVARAGHCVLVCDPRLAPLFRRSFPAASVVGYERRKDHQPASLERQVDWQVPAGSVPRFFRRRKADFPPRQQFLVADPSQVRSWRERFGGLGTGLRVGISWRAGGQPAEHRRRTTNLADWQPLLSVAGIQWINLQYGESGAEREWARAAYGVTIHDWPEGDPLVDLDGFAARLAALDLVISVGNATVHLAGALGVSAWAILPQTPNWRWGLQGEQSIWYASVRLVRQGAAGDWAPVFEQLARELGERVASPADPTTATSVGDGREFGPAPAPRVGREVTDMQCELARAGELFAVGRLAEAEAACAAVLCLAPRQVRGLHLYAQICRRSGRWQAALDALRRALAVQERPELHSELGLVLAALGQGEDSRRHFERAQTLDAQFTSARAVSARSGRGCRPSIPRGAPWFAVLEGYFSQPRRKERMTARAPTFADAIVHYDQGQPAEAEAICQQLLTANPANQSAPPDAGRAGPRCRAIRGLARLARRGLAYGPQDPILIFERGVTHYRMGGLEAATDEYTPPCSSIRTFKKQR